MKENGSISNGCGSQEQCSETGCGGGDGSGAQPPAAQAAGVAAPAPGTICIKCRKQEAEIVARGREPLCHPCLYDQLLSKVRNAVRLHSLIQHGDSVALAFSGGPASAALLRFLSELRNPRTDRPARGKVSFTLHIVHIDESATLGLSAEAACTARASVADATRQYCQQEAGDGLSTPVQYHCVPLEAVFEEDWEEAKGAQEQQSKGQAATSGARGSGGGSASLAAVLAGVPPRERQRQRLARLLGAIADTTGRQDLARHLRARLLLRCAAALGCTRLARGDCATTLAGHIVAAASKGCGYSLPGDVQLFDARHGAALPAVMLPLREVSTRELCTLCARWGLPLAQAEAEQLAAGAAGRAELSAADKKNINVLAAAFIAGMEAHNPGSVPNILNAISKLQAFPWNQPPQANQQQQSKQKRPQQLSAGAAQAEGAQAVGAAATSPPPLPPPQQLVASVLCPICSAPLADDELPGSLGSSASAGSSSNDASSVHTSGGTGAAAAAAAAGCCLSCFAQILGNSYAAGPSSTASAAGSGSGSGSGSGNGSESVSDALPAAVQLRMTALAAAGNRATAAATTDGDAGSNKLENLRLQIADFLLE